jgi:hypothetical protein
MSATTEHLLPVQAISEEVLIEKYAKGNERKVDDVRRHVARALAQPLRISPHTALRRCTRLETVRPLSDNCGKPLKPFAVRPIYRVRPAIGGGWM